MTARASSMHRMSRMNSSRSLASGAHHYFFFVPASERFFRHAPFWLRERGAVPPPFVLTWGTLPARLSAIVQSLPMPPAMLGGCIARTILPRALADKRVRGTVLRVPVGAAHERLVAPD